MPAIHELDLLHCGFYYFMHSFRLLFALSCVHKSYNCVSIFMYVPQYFFLPSTTIRRRRWRWRFVLELIVQHLAVMFNLYFNHFMTSLSDICTLVLMSIKVKQLYKICTPGWSANFIQLFNTPGQSWSLQLWPGLSTWAKNRSQHSAMTFLPAAVCSKEFLGDNWQQFLENQKN